MLSSTQPKDKVMRPVKTEKGYYILNYNDTKNPTANDPMRKRAEHILNKQLRKKEYTPREYTNLPKYPLSGPCYDWETENKSFIDVHNQLKMRGVKNNAFHLILLNPGLKGIDPYSENLTIEQKLMIIQECQLNIFYFLREVVRIPEQGKGYPVRFKLDRGTLAALFCFANDINFYLIKPRQTGKSVGIDAMLAWAFKFGITNGQFMFAGNKEKTPKDNLKKMKHYISLLPPYIANLGTKAKDSSGHMVRKTNNVKSYVEPATNNSAMVAGCAVSETAAEEIGRGDSHTYEFFDEAEFTSYIETIVQVSGMAFNTASQNAINNGGHACRIFASTPGDLSDEKKCQSALKIVEKSVTWKENFYDDYGNDIKGFHEFVRKNSSYAVVYIEYSYQQLGYGEEWFRTACQQVGHNVAKIRREILLQRFSGNALSPFSEQDIIEINENKKAPVFVQTVNKIYDLRFYQKPEEIKRNRLHFIAIDPSDGTGSDFYGMVVVDPYTLETVMEFKSQYMAPSDCRKLVEFMVKTYFPKVMIIVESNRNGIAVIDNFKEGWLKPFIYASPEADSSAMLAREDYDERGFIKEQLMRRKYFGVKTLSHSRDVMMGLLTDAVRFKKDVLVAEYLVQDINDLILKGGKIQAAAGKHDDLVMAWCLCMYTIYYGEKLERWGFRRGVLPDDVEMDDEFKQLQDLYKNPVIRQQFPTMYAFWEETAGKKMKEEHEKKVKKELSSHVQQTGFGVISEDEIMLDGPNSSTANDTAWRNRMKDMWYSLNK